MQLIEFPLLYPIPIHHQENFLNQTEQTKRNAFIFKSLFFIPFSFIIFKFLTKLNLKDQIGFTKNIQYGQCNTLVTLVGSIFSWHVFS